MKSVKLLNLAALGLCLFSSPRSYGMNSLHPSQVSGQIHAVEQISIEEDLFLAIHDGNLENVRGWVSEANRRAYRIDWTVYGSQDLDSQIFCYQLPLLSYAVALGHEKIVRFLVTEASAPVNPPAKSFEELRRTPLAQAIFPFFKSRSNYDMTALLLNLRADVKPLGASYPQFARELNRYNPVRFSFSSMYRLLGQFGFTVPPSVETRSATAEASQSVLVSSAAESLDERIVEPSQSAEEAWAELGQLVPYLNFFHELRGNRTWQYPPGVRAMVSRAIAKKIKLEQIVELLKINPSTVSTWKYNYKDNIPKTTSQYSSIARLKRYSEAGFDARAAIRDIIPVLEEFNKHNREHSRKWHTPPEIRIAVYFAVRNGLSVAELASELSISKVSITQWAALPF